MASEAIRCPHCSVSTAVEFETFGARYIYNREDRADARYAITFGYCQNPGCGLLIVRLREESRNGSPAVRYVIPRSGAAMKFRDVPPELVSEYEQANAVLDASPAASAALARRCLQRVIREHMETRESRFYDELEAVAKSGKLPPYLADGLCKIREIGDLAKHPPHGDRIGVIVDVSQEEAEWTLKMLEGMFKHCFVDPKEFERRTRGLKEKLGGPKDRVEKSNEGSGAAP